MGKVRFRAILAELIIVGVLCYVIALMIGPALFESFFMLFGLTVFASVFLTFLFLVIIISKKTLSADTKKLYEGHETRFNIIVFSCVAFFLIVCWNINYRQVPQWIFPLTLFGYIGIAVCCVLIGWCLITRKIWKIAVTIVFIGAFIGANIFNFHQERLPSEKAQNGYNLYTDYIEKAYLMDMDGKIVHEWQFPFEYFGDQWAAVELLENGEIISGCNAIGTARLDKDSNIIWIEKIPAHHDIEVLPDGSYLIIAGYRHIPYKMRKVQFEWIVHASSLGKELGEWAIFENLNKILPLHPPHILDTEPTGMMSRFVKEMLYFGRGFFQFSRKISRLLVIRTHETGIKENNFSEFVQFIARDWSWRVMETASIVSGRFKEYDFYHLNTVEVLPDTPLGRKDKRFQAGNHMICLRNVNLIVILDKDTKDIVWSWGVEELDYPHMPTMLKNGNILIYDNGYHRSYSRIVEVEPVSGDIVWEYKASPPEKFHSITRGSSQRLPNGNTLICESEKGRAFEVTPKGKIVWEYLSPEIGDKKRQMMYRMIRISDPKKLSFLKDNK